MSRDASPYDLSRRDARPERRRQERRTEPVERPLPHSLEAERAVLGAILINPQVMATLPDGFTEEAFYREAHRTIYRAAQQLRDREVQVDLVTLREELRRESRLDEVGGPAYVASLVDGVPRAINCQYYAGIVGEHATRRRLIALANRALVDAYEAEKPVEETLAAVQEGVVAVAGFGQSPPKTLGQLMPAMIRAVTDEEGRFPGVPTGYAELDTLTTGLQPSELALLAARPSVGKTALAVNIAEHVGEHVGRVLVFSLEMTKEKLNLRMVSARARVEGHRIRTRQLEADEYTRIARAMTELADVPVVLDDTSNLAVEDLGRRAQRVMLQEGPVVLVIVDYLQLLGTHRRFENNRVQQVSFISASLKQLAKQLGVPVLALSQLSRAVEQEGKKQQPRKPRLSDLRESGSLEQDADLVMFLHRRMDDEQDPTEAAPVDLIVAKQRNGPVGTVKLYFTEAYTRYDGA